MDTDPGSAPSFVYLLCYIPSYLSISISIYLSSISLLITYPLSPTSVDLLLGDSTNLVPLHAVRRISARPPADVPAPERSSSLVRVELHRCKASTSPSTRPQVCIVDGRCAKHEHRAQPRLHGVPEGVLVRPPSGEIPPMTADPLHRQPGEPLSPHADRLQRPSAITWNAATRDHLAKPCPERAPVHDTINRWRRPARKCCTGDRAVHVSGHASRRAAHALALVRPKP